VLVSDHSGDTVRLLGAPEWIVAEGIVTVDNPAAADKPAEEQR
jgi:hypothetical protein